MNPWFSGFKPVTWQGWIVYATALVVLVYQLLATHQVSDSFGDTLVGFFPQAAIVFLVVALIIRARNISTQ